MRKKLLIFISILGAIILASFLGELAKNIPALSWLAYGKNVGIENFSLNLEFIKLTFSMTLKCTVATVLGLLISGMICFKVF